MLLRLSVVPLPVALSGHGLRPALSVVTPRNTPKGQKVVKVHQHCAKRCRRPWLTFERFPHGIDWRRCYDIVGFTEVHLLRTGRFGQFRQDCDMKASM